MKVSAILDQIDLGSIALPESLVQTHLLDIDTSQMPSGAE